MRITSLSKRIIRRIGLLILVMFILSLVVFFLARLAPGDPLQSFYGDQLDSMTQEEIDAARVRLSAGSPMPCTANSASPSSTSSRS